MKRVRLATSWLLFLPSLVLIQAIPLFAAEQSSAGGVIIGPQPSAPEDGRLLNRQPREGSSTLEIAPQPSTAPRPPDGNADKADGNFKPDQDLAAIDRDRRIERPDDGRRPYLGIELQYTSQCLMGMEEHGFEILSIEPNSPAARAGLKARKPTTAIGELEAMGSVFAFPLALFTVPRLRRSGALGMPGDMIVAVDDHRVRTEQELMRELDPLRPGDTAYITVIRPVVGGGHQTLRIAVHIDRTIDPPDGEKR
jgi:hypothetical protein